MACIFSCRNKALLPYKEHFDAFLDEKKFKEQLVIFKIAEDDGDAVLHGDHRQFVMPVLLRYPFNNIFSHFVTLDCFMENSLCIQQRNWANPVE